MKQDTWNGKIQGCFRSHKKLRKVAHMSAIVTDLKSEVKPQTAKYILKEMEGVWETISFSKQSEECI